MCVYKKYEKKRVVPEYSPLDTNVDWRDWNVVSPV